MLCWLICWTVEPRFLISILFFGSITGMVGRPLYNQEGELIAQGGSDFSEPIYDVNGHHLGHLLHSSEAKRIEYNTGVTIIPDPGVTDGHSYYDSHGNFLGYVQYQEQVFDSGPFFDADGNELAQDDIQLGTPLYDADGNFLGHGSHNPDKGSNCKVSLDAVDGEETFVAPPVRLESSPGDGSTVSFSVSQTLREQSSVSWMGILFLKSVTDDESTCIKLDQVPFGRTEWLTAECMDGSAVVHLYLKCEPLLSSNI